MMKKIVITFAFLIGFTAVSQHGFDKETSGFYFFLGGMTSENKEVFLHHTPGFFIDERGILLGIKTFIQMPIDYLNT